MFIDSVFWSAAAVLAYSHIGYPLLLWVWARYCVDKPPTGSADPEPYVSVLLVAYNEAAQMRARIENLLALDYPRNRLEIILASDGSSDGTVAAAAEYRTQGVRIVAFNQRRGKSAVL
ncbi:MAG TPA: glycosyltransferase, partial [Gammaproteobacteria bacterium]